MKNATDRGVPTERDPLLHPRSSDTVAVLPAIDPDSDNSLQPGVVQPSRKFVIEPAVLLFCAGILSQTTIVTQYLYYRVGQEYNGTGNSTRAFVCDPLALANATELNVTSRIQSESSQWILYRNLAGSLVALLLMPIYASSSDYLGRKPAIIIPCVGLALDAIGLLLVLLLDLPLIWIVISGGVGALGGGYGTLIAALFAYLSDTTTRQGRPVRIAIVESMLGLAGTVMELVVGWFIRLAGYAMPMVFSGLLTLANLVYVAFLVPEVRPRRQIPSRGAGGLALVLSPFINIAGLFGISGRLAVTLSLLLIAIGVYSASFTGMAVVSSLYQMNYPFCLDSVFIGYLNAAKIVGFQLGVLLGLLVLRRCLGVRPLGLAVVGLVSAILGALVTGIARSTPMLLVASAFAMFSMLPTPMLRAYTSQIAPVDRQGALFSCISVLDVAGNLAGSVAFIVVYRSSQAWMPGFVYLAVSITTLAALVLVCACAFITCCCRRCCPEQKVTSDVVTATNGNCSDDNRQL